MTNNLSHNLKRVVAGLCAVLMVSSAADFQTLSKIGDLSVIHASAEPPSVDPGNTGA